MKIGYARVSSKDQNLDRQLDAFAKEGVEKIFQEKVSGKSTEGRHSLNEALSFAREGDTFIVLSLDRLARSLHDLLAITEELNKKGVFLKSLHENIDLSGPSGKLMFNIFGSVAEFERSITNQRRQEGIEAAKARGKRLGRPKAQKPKNWDNIIPKWKAGEITAVMAIEALGMTKPTFYRMVKQEKSKELE
jgi:DNA invertase Pin-like site-specific DNA recombinase